jgi:hypothetical protein
MDSESLNNKLEQNVIGFLFTSSGLRLASFNFAAAKLKDRALLIGRRFNTFIVRGGGS